MSIGHHSFAHHSAMSIQDSRIHSDPRLCVISRRLDPICSHCRTLLYAFTFPKSPKSWLLCSVKTTHTPKTCMSLDLNCTWKSKSDELFFLLKDHVQYEDFYSSPVDSGFLDHMRDHVRSLKSWWVYLELWSWNIYWFLYLLLIPSKDEMSDTHRVSVMASDFIQKQRAL